MPLCEYECDAHAVNRFEKIQKFSDPLEDTCPKCGGPDCDKLMSSPAIQFKGSGFYITDYPKGDKGSAPKSDGGKKRRAAGKGDATPKGEVSGKCGGSSGERSRPVGQHQRQVEHHEHGERDACRVEPSAPSRRRPKIADRGLTGLSGQTERTSDSAENFSARSGRLSAK